MQNEIEETQKKKKKWPWVVGAIVVIGIIGAAMGGGNNDGVKTSNSGAVSSNSSTSVSATAASTADTTASTISSSEAEKNTYSATLLPGYYEIGTDIPAGTYDFEIASGNGNVTDMNDGVNLIMGKQSDDMYQKSYQNAELSDGATLFVQQCSIKVSSSDAGETTARDNSSAKEISVASGKYTSGKDFQPGYYDITLDSGSGNVICLDNQLNAIFSEDSAFGVKEYKNVPFKSGSKLDVEGPKVTLTPSK